MKDKTIAASPMLESPISKKLLEEEIAAETPAGPSTPPKRERTSEELATSIALCVALEAIATLEASRFVPLRAPLPVRLGMYLSRGYLWSRALGGGGCPRAQALDRKALVQRFIRCLDRRPSAHVESARHPASAHVRR